MKKICIFGANGFIGSNLLPKFEKDFFNTAVIREKKNNNSDVLPKLNTVIDVNFTVSIDENVDTLPKKFIVHCWDRILQFFHNNIEINLAYEKMKELENN